MLIVHKIHKCGNEKKASVKDGRNCGKNVGGGEEEGCGRKKKKELYTIFLGGEGVKAHEEELELFGGDVGV